MKCVNFSETKAERKYYEDKKQKALRYIDHTIEDWYDVTGEIPTEREHDRISKFTKKLIVIKKLVNDI